MLEELRNLQVALNKTKSSLPKPLTKQIQGKKIKVEIKKIVDSFFRSVRPSLVQLSITDPELANIDLQMQGLLEFSHKNVTGARLSNGIKDALSSSVILERVCLTRTSNSSLKIINASDEKIIQTLKALLPSAASSYEQAFIDLQSSSRLSWRGPATDLREALRETLDHLAPDKDVEKQPGFKLEKDTRGPTMKQKVRFVLSKRNLGSAATATTENAVSTIEDVLGSFVRSIYTRSNVSTHTPTNKDEVLRVRDLVRVALSELLEIPT